MAELCEFSDAISFKPREYQLEMFRESVKRNIIVAMDTGSGKTAIALLRIREELELNRVAGAVWFLCPTVTLCEQQLRTIRLNLPSYPSRLLCGKDGIDAWKSQKIWDDALRNIRIVVCTHQVLLDGLSHGFIDLRLIPLLVFDEAHHCYKNHPSNRIMNGFYHTLRDKHSSEIPTRVLGLTASPVVRSGIESLKTVEKNLNSLARTPILHREELLRHVHIPEIRSIFFQNSPVFRPPLLLQLISIFRENNFIIDLPSLDAGSPELFSYSETLPSGNDQIQKSVKRLLNTAITINADLGPWMSELYIASCAHRSVSLSTDGQLIELSGSEHALFKSLLKPLNVEVLSIEEGSHTSKLLTLADTIAKEMNPETTGIIFVKTRTETYLLAEFLSSHPITKGTVRVGTCVGSSNHSAKISGIAELVNSKDQAKTLAQFQKGKINLLVATSVCEEGLDFRECNLVVCFELPLNLKSFIQRRGRARHEKSKFILIVPEGESDRLKKWHDLEKTMIDLYMDDLRKLENLESLEKEETMNREFIVESTGARVTYDNAVPYLHHFCDKLPRAAHTQISPVYTFEFSDEYYTCNVLLPLSVDATVREFDSSRAWKTQAMARKDVSLEACIELYKSGLLNENLLPSPSPDSKMAMEYEEIAKRPPFENIEAQWSMWSLLSSKWNYSTNLHTFHVTLRDTAQHLEIEMIMIAPCNITYPSKICLYPTANTTSYLLISRGPEMIGNRSTIRNFNKITHTIFASLFGPRMQHKKLGFPLLFVPKNLEDTQTWLSKNKGSIPASELVTGKPYDYSIVRHSFYHGTKYSFLSLEETEKSEEFPSGFKLKCCRFPKRINFLTPVSNTLPQGMGQVYYFDPQACEIDCLSRDYVKFSRYIPALMHHIGVFAIAEELRNTLLAPVGFSNSTLVVSAISTPIANEETDYQRFEFLGDAVLKCLTAISISADHPTWHEGYMSNRKDHIVSNGRLAKAALDIGLAKFIITKAFTGVKWRPLYNDEVLSAHPQPEREISTKVLADVVEAVIGAAYLEGGESKALQALRIFIPEVLWNASSERVQTLQQAISLYAPHPDSIPQLQDLETILDYKFDNRALLLEAITHPSHMSQSISVGSYERLEFLGDALLDDIVTTKIFQHSTPLPVAYMHLLRTATVNASFLAFCALSRTISVDLCTMPAQNERDCKKTVENQYNITEAVTAVAELKFSLPIYLRHAPSRNLAAALANTRKRFGYLSSAISSALATSEQPYPWRLLAAFHPEKVYSDLVESTLAAVWIDSGGDMSACERFLRSLGILTWLEQALTDQRKVWHPKEEIGALAVGDKIKYEVGKKGEPPLHTESDSPQTSEPELTDQVHSEESDSDEFEDDDNSTPQIGQGKWWCKIFIAGRELAKVRGWNRAEVETAAAEEAIAVLSKTQRS